MKKLSIDDLKIIEINPNTFQIEAAKKAIVIRALSHSEALKIVCKYLGINCNKHSLKG
jgi:hypothetical protein